jgi:hypothetical protein
MATLGKLNLNVNDLIAENMVLIISLQGVKSFRVRLWAGKQLLKLSAWIIGCGIRVDPAVKEL